MEQPPSWYACARLPPDAPRGQSDHVHTSGGVSYCLVEPTAGPAPALIDDIIMPVKKGWCCDTELVSMEPAAVRSETTNGVQRVIHRAEHGGDALGETRWAVGIELIEQPMSSFAGASLVHTDNLTYQHWEPERLLTVVAQRD